MRSFQLLITTAILLFLLGCSQKSSLVHEQSKMSKKTTKNIKETAHDSSLIPESLFLENRVDNCDSAIVFMKSVISPGNSGWSGFVVPGESKSFLFQDKPVDKHFLVPNNQRFYISLDCLIGQNIQTILDIFVKPKFHNGLLKKYKTEEEFVLYVKGLDCVGFYLFGQNGVIKKAKFNYTQRVH